MDFELRVETHPERKAATLRLVDADGVQHGYHQISFPDQGPAFWEGLFDTRRFVRRYTGSLLWDGQTAPATAEALLERLGAFLGQQVLGPEILQQLGGWQHRTLTIHLPAAADDVIAAALARVPWEIARPSAASRPLMGADLVVRAVTDDVKTGTGRDQDDWRRARPADPLRVLLVFAEAPGSRPLAMRLERERLLALF